MTNAPAAPEPDLLVQKRGAVGVMTLNRPAALNALTLDMVRLMDEALDAFEADNRVKSVVVRGAGGKAFCAGGDIRKLHDAGKAGDLATPLTFWCEEYRLNQRIKAYPKPYVAMVDGICMGGGVGVSEAAIASPATATSTPCPRSASAFSRMSGRPISCPGCRARSASGWG